MTVLKRSKPRKQVHKNRLAIGLQGGGSFGAFAWGVLDRLFDEPDLDLEAVSGASAGAVNAVLLASGLLEGGPAAAKTKLARFWRRMSDNAPPVAPDFLKFMPLGIAIRNLSPYQFNPLNINPLRDALADEVDFDGLRKEMPIKLLISATRVSDGRPRIFRENEVTLDAVLASSCLPLLYHAVTVDGEAYWDGGYAANPPLFPLALVSEADDLLAVLVTPTHGEDVPTDRDGILRRLEHIRFNAAANAEFEAQRFGALAKMSARFERLRLARISASDELPGLAGESASDLGWGFLERLRDAGHAAASTHLAAS